MKGYETYSVTQLPWCDILPAHWNLRRAKYMYKKENREVQPEDGVVTCFRDGTVTLRKNRRLTGFTEAVQETGYQGIRKGDLVIHVMDAFAGAVGVSDSDGKGTPVYSVCTAIGDYNNHYYALILREMAKKGFIQSLYRGIRERSSDFRFDVFAKQYLPVPPRDEQDQIVHFLDWKVSEINKLINIRKRQITELEELKRSKIGNIVMGQTFDVPPKETGVSWVKSIPAYWEEHALIQVAEEQQIKNTGMVEDNLLSLSYGKIINKDINTTDGLLPASFEGYQIINSGNIVLRLTDLQNDHRSLRTGLATQRGIITSAYTCLKARDNVLPEYLQLQLHVADLCKVFYGMGGGVRQSIGFKDIRRLIVAIPPLDEQRDILKAVNSIEVPINSVIAKYQEIILSLEELKTKLISDVITGKIDVRDVVIPDYEYVDEEVDFDDEGGNEETEEEENS